MQCDFICLKSFLSQAVGFTDNLDPAKMTQGLSWGFLILSPLLSLNPASPLRFGAQKIRDSALEEVTSEGHFGKGPGSVISSHPEHIKQWRGNGMGGEVCMSQMFGNWGKDKDPICSGYQNIICPPPSLPSLPESCATKKQSLIMRPVVYPDSVPNRAVWVIIFGWDFPQSFVYLLTFWSSIGKVRRFLNFSPENLGCDIHSPCRGRYGLYIK